MHHSEWHPNGTRIRTSLTWWGQPPSGSAVREWHPMAPTVGVLTATSVQSQPLYQHFISELSRAGDENRTRVLSLGKKRAVGRTTMDQSEPSEQVRTSATRRRTLMNGGVRGIFAGCDIPAKSAIRAVSSGRGGAFTSYKHRHLLRTRLDHLRSDARGGRAPSDGHEMSRLKVNLVPAAANANP
jgi:hypothetical protein